LGLKNDGGEASFNDAKFPDSIDKEAARLSQADSKKKKLNAADTRP